MQLREDSSNSYDLRPLSDGVLRIIPRFVGDVSTLEERSQPIPVRVGIQTKIGADLEHWVSATVECSMGKAAVLHGVEASKCWLRVDSDPLVTALDGRFDVQSPPSIDLQLMDRAKYTGEIEIAIHSDGRPLRAGSQRGGALVKRLVALSYPGWESKPVIFAQTDGDGELRVSGMLRGHQLLLLTKMTDIVIRKVRSGPPLVAKD